MTIHNYKIFGVTVPSYVSSVVVLLSAETPGMCVSGGCVQQPGSDPVRTLYCPYLEDPKVHPPRTTARYGRVIDRHQGRATSTSNMKDEG